MHYGGHEMTGAEFVWSFRVRMAQVIARNRKKRIRRELESGCVVIRPGCWKRPDDWMRETEEDQRLASRTPLREHRAALLAK
jgi:hypothetical protein